MIPFVCGDCGGLFYEESSFTWHNCDVPDRELPGGMRVCDECLGPSPCREHQPVSYRAAREVGA